MGINLGSTTYPGGDVNTVTQPYSDPRGALAGAGGFGIGSSLSDLLRFKASLALRNQALKEQAAADVHRGFSEDQSEKYRALERASRPVSGPSREPVGRASTQAAALGGGLPLFGVRGLGNVLKPWSPGTPLGPGQVVEAMGYTPPGYGVPQLPQNSNIMNMQDDAAGLKGIYKDEEDADKQAAARKKLAEGGGGNDRPDWWGTSSTVAPIKD